MSNMINTCQTVQAMFELLPGIPGYPSTGQWHSRHWSTWINPSWDHFISNSAEL